MRTEALAFVLVPLLAGCGWLNPKTAVHVANDPIAASANEAVVVFTRPRSYNPFGEVLRIFDESRRPIADLRVGEHAVVRMPPGAHDFFASAWSSEIDEPWCVGAMRATLDAGRVYPVRAATYPTLAFHAPWVAVTGTFDCLRVELYRVPRGDYDELWRWLRHDSERVALLDGRPRVAVLDQSWRGELALTKGRARMAGGAPWSAAWSTLSPGDGDLTVP